MAKRVAAIVKLNLPAGKASPAYPVGPMLGQHGVNIMAFVREYNERTAAQAGSTIPAEVTIYEDRTFAFVTKAPPVAALLRQAAGVEKGSGAPGRHTIGAVSHQQVLEIARLKLPELNTSDLERAARTVAGAARSMGIEIV
jgi:large subunit ribosomal protein L11